MNLKSLLFAIAAHLCAASLFAQTTVRVVNGETGDTFGTSGKYSSVTAALASPPAGNLLINIEGMTSGGTPFPYSGTAHPNNPGQQTETYPITIPSDCWIRKSPSSSKVVIFTTYGSNALFQTPTSVPVNYQAILDTVILYGAETGFQITNSDSSLLSVQCRGVSFANCGTGLSARSAGNASFNTNISLMLDDCWVRDYPLFPTANVCNIGIELIASEVSQGGVGMIDADLTNLRTAGDFDGSEGQSESQLIRVIASGSSGEHEGLGFSLPIAEVDLSLQGGLLNGFNKDGGWNTGIYADAFSSRGIGGGGWDTEYARDYTAGYVISTSGLVMKSFIENGIEATCSYDARGEVYLNGGTKISETRDTSGNPQSGSSGTGVFMHNLHGYLALHADETRIFSNATNGVMLTNTMGGNQEGWDNNPVLEGGLPEGLYLDIYTSEIAGNGNDGIYAVAGSTTFGENSGGVVGGTRFWDEDDGRFYYDGSPWAQYPSGQGRIVRSKIHNNSGRGVHAQLYGFGNEAVGGGGIASYRLVRSVLWNNMMEGWFVNTFNPQCQIACPILFSTLAGNGEDISANANASVGLSSGAFTPDFSLDVSSPSGTPLLHTKFLHSVFARKNQTGGVGTPDFGGILAKGHSSLTAEEEDGAFSNASSSKIYLTGCRDSEDMLGIQNQSTEYGKWISFDGPLFPHTVTFFGDGAGGAVVWTTDNAEQFRFGDASVDLEAGNITDWIGDLFVPASEISVDFRGIDDTSFTGTNWSGGQNFQYNKGAFND